jgi:hypothetical protein
MKPARMKVASIALLVAATLPAQSQDLRINVLRRDNYASRRMVIYKKSGEKLSNVVAIRSFDPQNSSFTMIGVMGESVVIPTSAVQKVEFEQAVLIQSPMAQEASWKVSSIPGSAFGYKVLRDALKVDSGDLVLPASSPATGTPAPPVPAPATSKEQGKTVVTEKIVEAKRLTYDSSTKTFLVEVQEITYSKEVSGSSGASGVRK